ncbi:hypothetical protein K3495_g11031 [Podosphaera aphanis]|nr:hypothetical protein K3495_g11031 [Podosphaera aphanis]
MLLAENSNDQYYEEGNLSNTEDDYLHNYIQQKFKSIHGQDSEINTKELDHENDIIYLTEDSEWIVESATFPSSNPTVIKALGHKPAATITRDSIVNVKLPNSESPGLICCGVVPDNLFPGQLVLGRSLFHTLGVYTKEEGHVQLLKIENQPSLQHIDTYLVKSFNQQFPSVFRFDPIIPQKTVQKSTVEHHIDTALFSPVKIPIPSYSPAQCKVIDEFLEKGLKRKLIQKS